MQGFAYFPTIIYRDERPDLSEKYFSECVYRLNKIRKKEKEFLQTECLGKTFEFSELTNYFVESSINILREQGYSVEEYNFYVSGLWVQEIPTGMSTNAHIHKNSQICGWLFLETPVGGSFPIYHETRMNKSMIELNFKQTEEITSATNSIYFNNVIPGTVMFGNSWMQHQLSTNTSDVSTKCVHFIVSHKENI